ncbi:RAMP superfamily CRISPR-associated protein [Rhodovulum sp. DZ06]|uniref:RAMP superfamily CRISPR-associated protein n=1 Tax=Rhodovulum sp. DZ06 TaxID=3425126 RepID=UPI003D357593
MKRRTYSVTAEIRSPFLFPGAEAPANGLDVAALRDREGRPLIPQDQVRGVLRAAMAKVAAHAADAPEPSVGTLFGRESGDIARSGTSEASPEEAFRPERGRLLFSDLLMDQAPEPVQPAPRVKIDAETGRAQDGHLLSAELVAPLGAERRFRGRMIAYLADDEVDAFEAALAAACTWPSAVGAMKSAGFGEIVSLAVVREAATEARPRPATPSGRKMYRVHIDRPFLCDAERSADNVFKGREHVPGGAVKGALARRLALQGASPQTSDAFTRLSVSHVLPAAISSPLPLSLVGLGTQVIDTLGRGERGAELIDGQAPRPLDDWKHETFAAAERLYGHAAVEVRRDTRVHTAIAAETGTALPQKLFVEISADPGDHDWVCEIAWPDQEPDLMAQAAAILGEGLDGIGRTGATLRFEETIQAPAPRIRPFADKDYAVVLQTDAVMTSPFENRDPFAAYAAYWREALPGAELIDFCAAQRLAGGFVGLRFRPGGRYAPFWLTRAGSVFLLRNAPEERLKALVERGLDAPREGGRIHDWRSCPFVTENGYGRIRADHQRIASDAGSSALDKIHQEA